MSNTHENAAGEMQAAEQANASGRTLQAVIFDMDGVLTRTASVHAAAWQHTFEEYLRQAGGPYAPYQHPDDYLAHIDGRPRNEGVAAFLRSRGIDLPAGSPDDPPGFATIWAIGNLKNRFFNEHVAERGVEVFESTLKLVHALRAEGVRVGLATSSRNAGLILDETGTRHLFEAIIDGVVSARLSLRGKPAPDIFLAACSQLGVQPWDTVVVEDAVSGVRAGSQGGFGLTVGVAREGNEQELRDNGADIVVPDLEGLTPGRLKRLVQTHGARSATTTVYPQR